MYMYNQKIDCSLFDAHTFVPCPLKRKTVQWPNFFFFLIVERNGRIGRSLERINIFLERALLRRFVEFRIEIARYERIDRFAISKEITARFVSSLFVLVFCFFDGILEFPRNGKKMIASDFSQVHTCIHITMKQLENRYVVFCIKERKGKKKRTTLYKDSSVSPVPNDSLHGGS